MKSAIKLFGICLLLITTNFTFAQTAEEIVSNYLETIGGTEAWSKIKSIKMTCDAKAQGMDMPMTMYSAEPGKQRMDLNFQGQQITQLCFNGETGWSTNFQTMEAQAWDSTQSAIMKSQTEFPDPFFNYKEKGYSVELDGTEEIEGTECFKLILNKKPVMVDGKEEDVKSVFFMEKESFVPIMQRDFSLAGPMKGQTIETYMSDYNEVEGQGVYLPFTIAQKAQGQTMFEVTVKEVEINGEIDNSFFDLPQSNKE